MRRGGALRLVTAAVVGAISMAGAAPALGAPRGTIRGRVINETSGELQAGVTVTLIRVARDGSEKIVARQPTDARGRYGFGGLAAGKDRFYALDARYRGGVFAGLTTTIPRRQAATRPVAAPLAVWETTTDPRAIVVQRIGILARAATGGIEVVESASVVNTGARAYIGRRGSSRGGASMTLGFALPAAADPSSVRLVRSDLNLPGLLFADFGFAATVAIPPGGHEVVYSYRLPGAGPVDLSRSALYPTRGVTLRATPPLDIRTNLEPDGTESVEGESYRRWSSRAPVDAGERVRIIAEREATLTSMLSSGALVSLVILAALVVPFLLFRRASAAREPPPLDERSPSAHDLVIAIAELDARREAGELAEEQWIRQRAKLKALLVEARTAELAS